MEVKKGKVSVKIAVRHNVNLVLSCWRCEVRSRARSNQKHFFFPAQPRAISDTDELEMARRLQELAEENQEVCWSEISVDSLSRFRGLQPPFCFLSVSGHQVAGDDDASDEEGMGELPPANRGGRGAAAADDDDDEGDAGDD